MKKFFTLSLLIFLVFNSLSAQTFTDWTFEGKTTAPSMGSGTVTNIGGVTNGYSTGNGSATSYVLKSFPAQGTASGTAGVSFMASTAGRSHIIVRWAQKNSRGASKYVAFQYTTDGTNWVTADLDSTNTKGTKQGIDVDNNLFYSIHKLKAGKDYAIRVVDLTSVTAADNNANFGFRIVTVFEPGTAAYAPTKEGYTYSTDNGGIRIDDVEVGENSLLPLVLTSFNALLDNNRVSLSWTTSNEINVQKFEVEKSADANNYNAIGEVAAKNIISGAEYSFADTKLLTSAFYRLKMIDKDGSFKYSNAINVKAKAPLTVSVFPNPVVTDNLVVTHPTASKGAALQIVSMDGKNVRLYRVQENAIQTTVPLYNIAKGNYFVVFQNAGQRQTIQIVKQ